jgi:hypothetical protein
MAYYVQSLVDMQRKPEAFPSGGRGRDGPSSVDWGRPPHRSEQALLTHSAPVLVRRERDGQG